MGGGGRASRAVVLQTKNPQNVLDPRSLCADCYRLSPQVPSIKADFHCRFITSHWSPPNGRHVTLRQSLATLSNHLLVATGDDPSGRHVTSPPPPKRGPKDRREEGRVGAATRGRHPWRAGCRRPSQGRIRGSGSEQWDRRRGLLASEGGQHSGGGQATHTLRPSYPPHYNYFGSVGLRFGFRPRPRSSAQFDVGRRVQAALD